MVVGYLQSLVPAIPGNIGASFLRPVYLDLRNLGDTPPPNNKAAKYLPMTLSEKANYAFNGG